MLKGSPRQNLDSIEFSHFEVIFHDDTDQISPFPASSGSASPGDAKGDTKEDKKQDAKRPAPHASLASISLGGLPSVQQKEDQKDEQKEGVLIPDFQAQLLTGNFYKAIWQGKPIYFHKPEQKQPIAQGGFALFYRNAKDSPATVLEDLLKPETKGDAKEAVQDDIRYFIAWEIREVFLEGKIPTEAHTEEWKTLQKKRAAIRSDYQKINLAEFNDGVERSFGALATHFFQNKKTNAPGYQQLIKTKREEAVLMQNLMGYCQDTAVQKSYLKTRTRTPLTISQDKEGYALATTFDALALKNQKSIVVWELKQEQLHLRHAYQIESSSPCMHLILNQGEFYSLQELAQAQPALMKLEKEPSANSLRCIVSKGHLARTHWCELHFHELVEALNQLSRGETDISPLFKLSLGPEGFAYFQEKANLMLQDLFAKLKWRSRFKILEAGFRKIKYLEEQIYQAHVFSDMQSRLDNALYEEKREAGTTTKACLDQIKDLGNQFLQSETYQKFQQDNGALLEQLANYPDLQTTYRNVPQSETKQDKRENKRDSKTATFPKEIVAIDSTLKARYQEAYAETRKQAEIFKQQMAEAQNKVDACIHQQTVLVHVKERYAKALQESMGIDHMEIKLANPAKGKAQPCDTFLSPSFQRWVSLPIDEKDIKMTHTTYQAQFEAYERQTGRRRGKVPLGLLSEAFPALKKDLGDIFKETIAREETEVGKIINAYFASNQDSVLNLSDALIQDFIYFMWVHQKRLMEKAITDFYKTKAYKKFQKEHQTFWGRDYVTFHPLPFAEQRNSKYHDLAGFVRYLSSQIELQQKPEAKRQKQLETETKALGGKQANTRKNYIKKFSAWLTEHATKLPLVYGNKDPEVVASDIAYSHIDEVALANLADTETGNTLMHFAAFALENADERAKKLLTPAIEMLLKHGGDWTSKNKAQHTPMTISKQKEIPPDISDTWRDMVEAELLVAPLRTQVTLYLQPELKILWQTLNQKFWRAFIKEEMLLLEFQQIFELISLIRRASQEGQDMDIIQKLDLLAADKTFAGTRLQKLAQTAKITIYTESMVVLPHNLTRQLRQQTELGAVEKAELARKMQEMEQRNKEIEKQNQGLRVETVDLRKCLEQSESKRLEQKNAFEEKLKQERDAREAQGRDYQEALDRQSRNFQTRINELEAKLLGRKPDVSKADSQRLKEEQVPERPLTPTETPYTLKADSFRQPSGRPKSPPPKEHKAKDPKDIATAMPGLIHQGSFGIPQHVSADVSVMCGLFGVTSSSATPRRLLEGFARVFQKLHPEHISKSASPGDSKSMAYSEEELQELKRRRTICFNHIQIFKDSHGKSFDFMLLHEALAPTPFNMLENPCCPVPSPFAEQIGRAWAQRIENLIKLLDSLSEKREHILAMAEAFDKAMLVYQTSPEVAASKAEVAAPKRPKT